MVQRSKHGVFPQLLRGDPRAGNAKGDAGQESRIIPDLGRSQDGLDLALVHTSFPRQVARLEEVDFGFRETEVAVPAPLRRHGTIVGEMSGQFPAEAARGGDEVDNAPDAVHVAFFSGFDLRVDGRDDLALGLFALGEVFEDTEAVHHAAGLEFDGAGVVPCLQFLHRVRSWEASASGGCVDVDSRPLVGAFAGLFECFGDW